MKWDENEIEFVGFSNLMNQQQTEAKHKDKYGISDFGAFRRTYSERRTIVGGIIENWTSVHFKFLECFRMQANAIGTNANRT